MNLTIEFTFQAADPRDAMSSDNLDIKEIRLDDEPLKLYQECDAQLNTALRAAIYRLKAILQNEPA